ncbi:nuclear transport factor 2 family protein [Azoarcus sp. PA01]|nr:nuclear transport factor 2 family protein [Azoarcus sp. PA01]
MSKPIYTSVAEAEAAFYDALARSDLDAMMTVWSEDDEVVCVHPDTPRLVGLAAVRESWRQLFAGGTRLQVRTSHHVVCQNMLLTIHNVIEHVAVEGEDRLPPPMIATNVYTRGALGWRLVMHHASPAPQNPHAPARGAPHVMH